MHKSQKEHSISDSQSAHSACKEGAPQIPGGTVPSKELARKYACSIDCQLSMDSGIVELKLFNDTSKNHKLSHSPTVAGKEPEKLLSKTLKTESLFQPPIDSGSVPSSALPVRLGFPSSLPAPNSSRTFKFPMVSGSVPVNELKKKLNVTKFTRLPIDSGREPVSSFEDRAVEKR